MIEQCFGLCVCTSDHLCCISFCRISFEWVDSIGLEVYDPPIWGDCLPLFGVWGVVSPFLGLGWLLAPFQVSGVVSTLFGVQGGC